MGNCFTLCLCKNLRIYFYIILKIDDNLEMAMMAVVVGRGTINWRKKMGRVHILLQ